MTETSRSTRSHRSSHAPAISDRAPGRSSSRHKRHSDGERSGGEHSDDKHSRRGHAHRRRPLRKRVARWWRESWQALGKRLTADAATGPRRTVQFNTRLAVRGVAALLVFIALGLLVHAVQVRLLIAKWSDRAETLQADGKWQEAYKAYSTVIAYSPDDQQAQIGARRCLLECAVTFEEKEWAVASYLQVLASAGGDATLRRRLADELLRLGHWLDAAKQAEDVLREQPDDPQAARTYVIGKFMQARTTGREVAMTDSFLQEAVAGSAQDIGLHLWIASMYREGQLKVKTYQRPLAQDLLNKLADELIDRMVSVDPENPNRRLSRLFYRAVHGLPDKDQDLDTVLASHPDLPQAVAAAAQRATSTGQLDEAFRYYQKLIELEPKAQEGYLGLGHVLMLAGRHNLAAEAWQLGLKRFDRADPTLNIRLAEAHLALRELPAMAQDLKTANDALYSTHGKTQNEQQLLMALEFLWARYWMEQGSYSSAITRLKNLLHIDFNRQDEAVESPAFREVYRLLERCYVQTHNNTEAKQMQRTIARLDTKTGYQNQNLANPQGTERKWSPALRLGPNAAMAGQP